MNYGLKVNNPIGDGFSYFYVGMVQIDAAANPFLVRVNLDRNFYALSTDSSAVEGFISVLGYPEGVFEVISEDSAVTLMITDLEAEKDAAEAVATAKQAAIDALS